MAQTPAAATQPAAAAYDVLEQRPDRLIAQLPNRLILVVQELHTAPVVSVQVWIKTGSIYEQEHVGAGLSHFLEHLLSAGTTTSRTEAQSNAILGSIGAQTNAATSLDNVHYYINTTAAYTSEAVELLSDWMQNSQIRQEEYERERSVIQREFEMGQGEPGRILWKLSQHARFQLHPARHPTIGYLDEFLKISRDGIYDFYKRMYVPNNMVFVVAGDVEKEKVAAQIASLWSTAQARPLPQLKFPLEPALTAPRQAQGVADIQRPRLRLYWPGTRLGAPGDYPLDLLAMILGQGESSRLVRQVRDEQRVVTTVSAYNMSFHWGQGMFAVDAEVAMPLRTSAGAAPGSAGGTGGLPQTQPASDSATNASSPAEDAIAKAQAAILEQIQRVQSQGITAEELARAKRKTMAQVVYHAQTADDLASKLASDIIATGDPDYLQHYVDAVQKVTAEEVQAAAKRFLDPQHMIRVTLLPANGQPVEAMTRPPEPATASDVRYEAISLDNARLLDELRASVRKAAQVAPVETSGIVSHELPNGLTLLVGRSTLVPAVAMQWYQVGGLLSDEPGREGLASAMATMMIKGTQSRSAEQIARQIDDLGAALTTSCGYNSNYAQSVCLKQDWPVMMDLMADVILRPTFPEDQWQRVQPRILAAIDRQMDSWVGELSQRFRDTYYGQHPWSVSPLGRRAVVEKLTVKDLADFHRQHLSVKRSVLAVVGDIDPQQVVREAQRLFASIPEATLTTPTPPAPPKPEAKLLQFQTNKPLAAVEIGYGPGITRDHPDYAGLQVLSNVLSSFPSGWLEQALRGEGPGLVYAVDAVVVTGLVPGYFGVLFNTQPATATEALSRTAAVVERARTELVDDATLARAKAAVLRAEFMSQQSNEDRAADAALDQMYGLGLNNSEKFIRDVREVDAQRIRVLAQTYLRNPVTVVLTHQKIDEEKLHQAMQGK